MNLCTGTPSISVRDNRGLSVRTLRYNRGVRGDIATQYVDAQTHNVLGQLAASQDPRFFGSAVLNSQYARAMSGQALETVSADGGTSKACSDIGGQPIWQYSQGRDANLQSDNDITVLLSYDGLGRVVQRVCRTADVSGGGSLGGSTDIWSYGDYSGPAGTTYDPTDTSDARSANQRGQLFQHFDTAGLIDMSARGYAVQGTALRQDRRFLDIPCASTSHWQPGTLKELYALNKQWLESDTDPANLYSTRWTYNALAQALTQVDAKGHQQHTAYDCAGRKCATSATPNGGTLTPVCAGIAYNAAGAIDTRSDANHIRIVYAYEAQTTQRLISITASRFASASNAAQRVNKERVADKDSKSHVVKPARASTKPLQALTYAYDGVGNVIALSDSRASAQVSFFRNRAVTPDRGYTYDALYQLTSATGRENYVNNTPKGTDWPGGQFNPANTPDYQAYTRSYIYDLGGNLTTIRSSNWSGAAPPTRQLVVSGNSNRAVSTANNAGATQGNIDSYFDLSGKSICLDANRNQPLYWTAFHQLYCVVTTYRPPTSGGVAGDWSNSDCERYAYDGSGQRVRKYASSKAGGTWNHLDTRYLPGLELRDDTASGENLEVIILDNGARILNWAGGTGKPSDISNLQLRYQYSDRQNSCQIETDSDGKIITQEEYYPYGGTAVLASRSDSEVKYKYTRYCGKERDATGLYYYGLRYYQPWIGRWINPDLAGTIDGPNLYRAMANNPATLVDDLGAVGGPAATGRPSDGDGNPEAIPLRVLAEPDAPVANQPGASEPVEQPAYEVVDTAAAPREMVGVRSTDVRKAVSRIRPATVVAFWASPTGRRTSPRDLFGSTVRYFANFHSGPPAFKIAGEVVAVDLEKEIDQAMRTVLPTAQAVGVNISKAASASEANLLFEAEEMMNMPGAIAWTFPDKDPPEGSESLHVSRIVFNREVQYRDATAFLSHYLIDDNLDRQWYKRKKNEFRSGAQNLRPWLNSLGEEARSAIAASLIRHTVVHEAGHSIFRLNHPEAIMESVGGILKLDPVATRQGDRTMISGLFSRSVGKSLFYTHDVCRPSVMSANQSTTFQQMAAIKLNGGTVNWGYSENEQASIIEAYRYGGMTRRRNLPEMLTALLPSASNTHVTSTASRSRLPIGRIPPNRGLPGASHGAGSK